MCENLRPLVTPSLDEKILLIDSRHYTDQNPNDLTVYLDEELSNIESMRIIYAGIPCTFHNISQALKNNVFQVECKPKTGSGRYIPWSVTLPDGFYDLRSFTYQFSLQLSKRDNVKKRMFDFNLDETSGKIVIKIRLIRQAEKCNLILWENNADLLGFNIPSSNWMRLPRKVRDPDNSNTLIDEDPIIGDKPINFKPF